MLFTKRFVSGAPSAPRSALRRGWWVLRTTETVRPVREDRPARDSAVMDPDTGLVYPSVAAAMPPGWEEAFRCEYIKGAEALKGRRAKVFVFPHEIVLVDPTRWDVSDRIEYAGTPLGTSVPAWVVPV